MFDRFPGSEGLRLIYSAYDPIVIMEGGRPTSAEEIRAFTYALHEDITGAILSSSGGLIAEARRPAKFTFALIKPDAIRRHLTLDVLRKINDRGFIIRAAKVHEPLLDTMKEFYREHEGKSFYEDLTRFMSSGRVVLLLLSHRNPQENVVMLWRETMGSTDPSKAASDTIRGAFHRPGAPIRENIVHGSDSALAARLEAEFFFSGYERRVLQETISDRIDINEEHIQRILLSLDTP